MRFLVDESSDGRVAAYLRGLGHDATTVAGDHQPGLPDPEVLARAWNEGRILITDDSDFGALMFRDKHPHAGVLYFRLDTTSLAIRINRIDHVLATYAEQLEQLIVITNERIRLRLASLEEADR